jgi:hypothetical protein
MRNDHGHSHNPTPLGVIIADPAGDETMTRLEAGLYEAPCVSDGPWAKALTAREREDVSPGHGAGYEEHDQDLIRQRGCECDGFGAIRVLVSVTVMLAMGSASPV